jgi:hypothetical protein
MFNQPTRNVEPTNPQLYHFVSRGSVGAICKTQNNRGSIFSPLGREPVRQAEDHRAFTSPGYIFFRFSFVTRLTAFHMQ